MNKISLYKTNIRYSRSFIISYGKAKSIGVNRGAAPRTREGISLSREVLFPHALSCSSSEGRWTFSSKGRSTDADEFRIGKRIGEAVQGRGHRWPKHYTHSGRGRKAIMDSSDKKAVRRAIEQDWQCVSKAKAAWEQTTGKEASDATFKRFLSALAQDISV